MGWGQFGQILVPFGWSVLWQRNEKLQWLSAKPAFFSVSWQKHHSKNKKCFVCNKPTLGIFNAAQEIRKKIAQDKKQQDL
ncbi:unnamed protein product [Triticum turgidum subsp. durum]|uniref:Uncharacterized protein n=1 Tax=Triticum turgidum subsp. durum TaxID=4567 RepID=A0A9R1BCQ5_TRITD|nr:unnamed protein product [Triticum turgidum subsp. durum]